MNSVVVFLLCWLWPQLDMCSCVLTHPGQEVCTSDCWFNIQHRYQGMWLFGKYPAMWGEMAWGGEKKTGRAEASSTGPGRVGWACRRNKRALAAGRARTQPPELGRVVAGRWIPVCLLSRHSKGQPSTLNSKLVFKMSEIENELCFYLTLSTFFQLQESTDYLAKIFKLPGSWLAYTFRVSDLFSTILIITIYYTELCTTYRVSSFLKKLFYWSIVGLQCCVNFYCIANWFIIHIYSFHILFHYGSSQDTEYSSLCYTAAESLLTKF